MFSQRESVQPTRDAIFSYDLTSLALNSGVLFMNPRTLRNLHRKLAPPHLRELVIVSVKPGSVSPTTSAT